MTDTYVGVRDGYMHARLAMVGKSADLPAYVPAPPARTGEDLYRDHARMIKRRSN